MKKIKFLLLICLSVTLTTLQGRVEMSPTQVIFRQITLSLTMDYLQVSKDLPISFEEIPMVRQQAKNNPNYIKNLNHLAIVPGTPVINSADGIPSRHFNLRLFAIGRTPDLEPKKLGRIVVWITEDGSGSMPDWVPEPEAQIILKQLKGFDPAKQPLVFQDLVQDTSKDPLNQKNLNQNARSSTGEGKSLSGEKFEEVFDQRRVPLLLWIGGGLVVVLMVGYLIRQKRSK